MNEEVQTQLLEWAKSAVSIANQQIPDIADQYLRWSLYSDIIAVALWLTALILSISLARCCWRQIPKDDSYVPGLVLGILLSLVFICCLGDNIYDLVKVVAAPKLYLLDYIVRSRR